MLKAKPLVINLLTNLASHQMNPVAKSPHPILPSPSDHSSPCSIIHSLTHSLEKFVVVVVVAAAALVATLLVKSRAPPCVLKTLGAALVGRWVGLFLM